MNKLLKYISYGFVVFIAWHIVFGVSIEKKERVLATTNAFLSCQLPKNTKIENFSFGYRTYLYAVNFQSSSFQLESYEVSLIHAGWKRIDNNGIQSNERTYQRGECINRIDLIDKDTGKWREFITQEKK